jgi:phage tail-like protein
MFVAGRVDCSTCRKASQMSEFPVNTHRLDPYKSFKFRIKWDGRYVAGISRVSALVRVTEVVEHRSGGEPNSVRKSPGITRFEPITLERGVTHDLEFENWANRVWQFGSGQGNEIALKDFRKNITLEVFNEAGQLAMAYNIYRCWPSEFLVLPELDANGNGVALQQITLENEGWERDMAITEPVEPG